MHWARRKTAHCLATPRLRVWNKTLTDEGEVALQQLPVRVKPSLSQPTVLVLANDVIHDVSQETGHHQDLHVVALPAVLQMCGDLTHISKTLASAAVLHDAVEKPLHEQFFFFYLSVDQGVLAGRAGRVVTLKLLVVVDAVNVLIL